MAETACLAEASERGELGETRKRADVAQLAERVLGKDEVTSSILVIGSILCSPMESRRRASDGRPGELVHRSRKAAKVEAADVASERLTVRNRDTARFIIESERRTHGERKI